MSNDNNQFPGLPSLPQRPSLQKPGVTSNKPSTSTPSGGLPFPKPTLPVSPVSTPQVEPAPVQQQEPAPVYVPESQVQPEPKVTRWEPPQQQLPPVQNDDQDDEKPKKRSSKTKRKVAADTETLKTVKAKPYSGKRRNVLIARVAIIAILALLVGNGIANMIPKTSGLTASDGPLIISQVRQNLNVSDFPRTKGEGLATAFSSVYLNYDPANLDVRAEALKTFGTEEVISNNEIRPASEAELAKDGKPADTKILQKVTQGPYVVDSLMFKGGKAALITTMSQINNKNWIYLQIPMYYNDATQNVSVSGPITFGNPNRVTEVPANELNDGIANDTDVANAISEDITTYMTAWVASDTTNIERYLVKENGNVAATLEARKGLGGIANVLSVSNLIVEAKERAENPTAEDMEDFYTRQAEVDVTLLDPSSNMVYQQSYRLVLKYTNDDWFVEDIRNRIVALDRDVILAENE